MEELGPEELEELVQELGGEAGAEEALSPEVAQLLKDLQPTRLYTSRRRAAEQLGEVNRSNREVVLALLVAGETDASADVRAAAGESLRAPVHQAVLQQHPELGERAQAVLERTAVARERELQRTLADETDTGQSRLAYRMAAAVLFLVVLINVVDGVLAWALGVEAEIGLCTALPILIDVGLGIGLIQLRKGARTWVLIRAGVGATLWPILLFLSNEPITAAIMSAMQWGFCGALLLLLTGESKTWRLALAAALFVVFTLGLFAVLILLVLLASAL